MSKIGLPSIAVACLALSGLFAVNGLRSPLPPERPRPILVAEGPIHEFGSATQGTTIQAGFAVRNQSDLPVTILDVIPSCSCTVGTLARRNLAPGESVDVAAEFGVGAARGRVDSMISLMYRAGQSQEHAFLELVLRGYVVPDVQASPVSLDFDADGTRELTMRFAPSEHMPNVKVLDVHSSHRALEVGRLESVAGGGWTVVVQFHSENWTQPTDEIGLVVRTSSQWEPYFRVPARVRGRKQ